MKIRYMEEKHRKRVALHSELQAIHSGYITKASKYLKSKHPVVLVAQPQSSIPWHAVFKFLIPVLLGVLQVHCQASNKSPFQTHLPNMLSFLFALLIYCFSYYYFNAITSQYPLHHANIAIPIKVSAHLAFLFGSLASAALISVLFPTHFELFVFIVWIIFIIVYFSVNFIICMMKWLYLSSKTAVSYIFRLRNHILGKNYDKSGTTIIV